MDVGSEISSKIQLAIKAKLIEINAYVDDELPDYIMIMIANRKPEEQMADALSLFLGDNSKDFTKWLYQLLNSLHKKSSAKETKVVVDTKINQNAKSSDTDKDEKKEHDSVKPSRWDVKKHVKRKSNSQPEPEEADTTAKVISSKEAVIEILPEKNDLFDEELLGGAELSSKSRTQSLPIETEFVVKPVPPPTKSTIKLASASSKEDVKSQTSKKSEKSSPEKKRKNSSDQQSKDSQSHSHSEKSKSNHKRSVAVKTKEKAKRVSTGDREFVSQYAPAKSKKKKLKRAKEKDDDVVYKEKSVREWDKDKGREWDKDKMRNWDKDKGREWDKDKGREPFRYSHSDSKKSLYQEKPELHSVKSRVSSLVSSTVTVPKDSLYESEDSDNEVVQSSSVISKVAVPQRRSRLPPSRQANRSLLLKAVSEAESSIKKHILAKKYIEPDTEEAFKTKVEKHKRIALGNVVKRTERPIEPKSVKSNISSKLLRQTNLLKPLNDDESVTKKRIKRKNLESSISYEDDLLHKNIVRSTDIENEFLNTERNNVNVQQMGDSRRIISRNQSTEKKLLVRRSKAIDVMSQQDSRKLLLKKSPKQNVEVSEEKRPIKRSRKPSEDIQSSSDSASPMQLKKKRSPSPCFIVTLDGSSSSHKHDDQALPVKKPKVVSKSEEKQLIACSKKANSILPKSEKESNVLEDKPSTAAHSTSASSDTNLSEQELDNMRAKLLAMQEQAKKLKEMQTKRQEQLQLKLSTGKANGQSVVKPVNYSVHLANVHFSATVKQISEHFSICGKVTRVTILKDKFTGHPKG